MYPPRRRRPSQPCPDPTLELGRLALAEMMRAEFDAKELDVRGEMLVPQQAEPPPPWSPRWQPVPIDWDEEMRERAALEATSEAVEELPSRHPAPAKRKPS